MYGSLKPYETQGFESAHIDDEDVMENTSKNGGKRCYIDFMVKDCQDKSLIQFLLRRVRLLHFETVHGIQVTHEPNSEDYRTFLKTKYPTFPTNHRIQAVQSVESGTVCDGNCKHHFSSVQTETSEADRLPENNGTSMNTDADDLEI